MPENRFANIESADDNNINTIPTTTQTINTDLAIFLKFTVFFFTDKCSFTISLLNFNPSCHSPTVSVNSNPVLYK